jgi:integrase
MKAKRAHIVPLSARCLEILKHARAMYPSSHLIFPGSARRSERSSRRPRGSGESARTLSTHRVFGGAKRAHERMGSVLR